MGFKWDIKSRIAAHTADLDDHIKDLLEQVRVGALYSGCGIKTNFTLTVNANRLYGFILFVARTMTFDAIYCRVRTLAEGKSARLGIYKLDSALAPGALVKDYGTVSVATTGAKSIAADQQLTRGYYLGAFISDGTPEMEVIEVAHSPLGQEASWLFENYDGYYVDQANGALPDPFPASPTIYRHIPAIALKVKSLD